MFFEPLNHNAKLESFAESALPLPIHLGQASSNSHQRKPSPYYCKPLSLICLFFLGLFGLHEWCLSPTQAGRTVKTRRPKHDSNHPDIAAAAASAAAAALAGTSAPSPSTNRKHHNSSTSSRKPLAAAPSPEAAAAAAAAVKAENERLAALEAELASVRRAKEEELEALRQALREAQEERDSEKQEKAEASLACMEMETQQAALLSQLENVKKQKQQLEMALILGGEGEQ